MFVHLFQNLVHFKSMTMGGFLKEKTHYLTTRYLYSFANMSIGKHASFCTN